LALDSIDPAVRQSALSTPLGEYFRCPAEFDRLTVVRDLPQQPAYFRFGEIVCYGRSSVAGQSGAAGMLPDTAGEVAISGERVLMPFDLAEVVDNLHHERYTRNGSHYLETMTSAAAARAAYYLLRPLLPVGVRKHLQKLHFSGWEKIPFPRWPLDVSVDALMEAAVTLLLRYRLVDRFPFIWFWPDGVPSCAILTHDVESKSGRDFCGALMDIDDSYGLKSSFQVIPEKRYEKSAAVSTSIKCRGFEVNVHDLNHDGHLFQTHEHFLNQVAEINAYGRAFQSRGFRAGAMYREQSWFGALNFDYDMSVPNVAHLEPQRGGCCTVMPFFIGDLVELPLTTVQDYALFHILGNYSTSLWRTQIDLIRRRHGLITLLTHPDYLIETRAQAVYRQLLNHVAQLRDDGELWFALPGEVERWWRSRSHMRLERAPDGWRVVGRGSERARVAFATLEGDRLVYEIAGPGGGGR
jgi:hypothetical protein